MKISGFTLRLMRQQTGLTLVQFAKLMKCTAAYCSMVERGKKRLTYSYVARAMGVFGLDIQDLNPNFEEVVH